MKRLLLLLAPLVIQACSDPVAVAPESCDASFDSVSSIGFVLDGDGFNRADVNFTTFAGDGIGVQNASMDMLQTGRIDIAIEAKPLMAGADTVHAYLAVVLPSGGLNAFSLLNPDVAAVRIGIFNETLTRWYKSESGSVVVTNFLSRQDTIAIAGRFCGTFRDSSGARVKITGGRFEYSS